MLSLEEAIAEQNDHTDQEAFIRAHLDPPQHAADYDEKLLTFIDSVEAAEATAAAATAGLEESGYEMVDKTKELPPIMSDIMERPSVAFCEDDDESGDEMEYYMHGKTLSQEYNRMRAHMLKLGTITTPVDPADIMEDEEDYVLVHPSLAGACDPQDTPVSDPEIIAYVIQNPDDNGNDDNTKTKEVGDVMSMFRGRAPSSMLPLQPHERPMSRFKALLQSNREGMGSNPSIDSTSILYPAIHDTASSSSIYSTTAM